MTKSTKSTENPPDFSVELIAKLKMSDPSVQCYIAESRKRISELVAQNVKLHLDKEELGAKIKVLEKENKRLNEESKYSAASLLKSIQNQPESLIGIVPHDLTPDKIK